MDPNTALALASVSVKLAQAAGYVRDEARELAVDTNNKVRALVAKDFDVALSMIEAASHADDEKRQNQLLAKALDRFENAEATKGLDRRHRGFAAMMCAALILRSDSEVQEAKHWAGRAVHHFDVEIRSVYKRAKRAADASYIAKQGEKWVPLVPWLPGANALLHFKARQESSGLPSTVSVHSINSRAADAHSLGRELGVVTSGKAISVRIELSKKRKNVKIAVLTEAP